MHICCHILLSWLLWPYNKLRNSYVLIVSPFKAYDLHFIEEEIELVRIVRGSTGLNPAVSDLKAFKRNPEPSRHSDGWTISLAPIDPWERQTCQWKTLIKSHVICRLATSTGGCKNKEVQLPRTGGEEEVCVTFRKDFFEELNLWGWRIMSPEKARHSVQKTKYIWSHRGQSKPSRKPKAHVTSM